MSQTGMTAEETFESLTGFDEIAISQQFGRTVAELAQRDPMLWMRSLIFVLKRRDGMNDPDSKNAALELTIKQATEYFAEDDEGKAEGSTQSEEQPAS